MNILAVVTPPYIYQFVSYLFTTLHMEVKINVVIIRINFKPVSNGVDQVKPRNRWQEH